MRTVHTVLERHLTYPMRGYLPLFVPASLRFGSPSWPPSSAPSCGMPAASHSPAVADSSWIVMLAPRHAAPRLAAGLTRGVGGEVGLTFTHAINGFQFTGSAAAAEALRRNPDVVSVSPGPSDHAHRRDAAHWVRAHRGVRRGHALGGAYHNGYRGNGARIAVLDTGIDLDHPDLVGSIDPGRQQELRDPGRPSRGRIRAWHSRGGDRRAAPETASAWSLAPEAGLVAVKVFDDSGNSSESLVLCGRVRDGPERGRGQHQ